MWQVVGKGAKFSLYKPAEEMVYISLDRESRTKGKAAIDVVGAQTGKSVGSVLQQVSLTTNLQQIN
jgi:AAA family ATP:ADP antiporter